MEEDGPNIKNFYYDNYCLNVDGVKASIAQETFTKSSYQFSLTD